MAAHAITTPDAAVRALLCRQLTERLGLDVERFESDRRSDAVRDRASETTSGG